MSKPWYDLVRKYYDTREDALESLVIAIPMMERSTEATLNRKLIEGFKLTSKIRQHVLLVEVIETIYKYPSSKFYLEMRTVCELEKI